MRQVEPVRGSGRPWFPQGLPARPGWAYRGRVDRQSEIREFLATRRARITPEQAGVPVFQGTRRVPGLRREEVAHLAGVSVDYYTRIERGKVDGTSQEVLDAIARALQLSDAERDHLMNLVRVRKTKQPVRRPAARGVPRNLQHVLDSITVPALVQNSRLEIIGANDIGKALYSLRADESGFPHSHVLFQFLNPDASVFYRDWELAKRNSVALLRAAAGRDPHDESLIKLVGQLSTQSEEFRQLWASHNVLNYRAGAKRYRHRIVGDVEFGYESFPVASDPTLTMLVYTVEPNSPTADAIALLASWTIPSEGPSGRRTLADRTRNGSRDETVESDEEFHPGAE
jgi:transcriptional regulator with XRE-family HTH domain